MILRIGHTKGFMVQGTISGYDLPIELMGTNDEIHAIGLYGTNKL
jgi:hypothetical protein